MNPKGNSTNPSNWDFGSSFFFAGTVVTTIGKEERSEGPASQALLSLGSILNAIAGMRMWFILEVAHRAQTGKWVGSQAGCSCHCPDSLLWVTLKG